MYELPADLHYSQDHLWAHAEPDGGLVRVGVTDYAQQTLGDVVDVSLPEPGESVTAGEPFGDIESVKSVNDLVAPVTGTVRARNDDLPDNPDRVNADPYGQGWMLDIETDPATLDQQLAGLMDDEAYRTLSGA
jgi:glycine cleavage system H protein